MSYFKYAERSSESRVDWNAISKGMVDMLKEQTRLRNEKLDDALELQNKITTTLSEAPMGSDESANQRISGFAADSKEYMLMMNKLWRSGEMSYREYMSATNNFQTNANGYLTQAERYNEAYEVHKKRMDEQLASGVEVSELARVEDFGNFNKFTPVIDAPTGSIGLVGDDGTNYASVTQLGVAVMSQYDRLDVNTATTELAKQMGTTVKVLKSGKVRTLESALQNEDYVKAEGKAVGSLFVDDNSHTSVLVDYDMGAYDTTHSVTEALADPMAILMVPSSRNKDRMIGSIEDDADFENYLTKLTIDGEGLTEEQKATLRTNREAQREQSFETVRDQLRARLDFKETPTADTDRRGLTDAERKRQQGVSVTQDGVDNLQAIFTAKDADTLEGALSYFEAKNPGIDLEVVNRNNERQLAILREGETETRYVTIGTDVGDYNKFVEAAGAYVIPNTEYLSEVLERAPLGENAEVGTQFGGVRSGRVVENLLTEEIELAGENVPFGSIPLSGSSEAAVYTDDDAQDAIANANYNRIMTGLSQLGESVESIQVNPISVEDVKDTASTDQPALMIFDQSKMAYPSYVSQGKSEVGRTMAVLEMVYNAQGNVDMDALMQLLGEDSRTITNSFNNLSGAPAAPSGPLSWSEWSAQNPNGTPQEYAAYFSQQ